MEDVKVREMQIFDYKKKIAEAETKLKQQQNLYEAVRSDRNLYSKNLIESQVRSPRGTTTAWYEVVVQVTAVTKSGAVAAVRELCISTETA